MYENKEIYVATKHHKEKVIKPIFENKLHCHIKPTLNFDTDNFGTFTGEVERESTPYITCVNKAKTAASKYTLDYVLSSEGSFGPHPSLYFIPADTEILVFYDANNDFVISESIVSSDTNYAHHRIVDNQQYDDFLDKIMFPSHKLILKDLEAGVVIEKGIGDYEYLSTLIKENIKVYNQLQIETDMRAFCNPSRMKVLELLAEKLASRISNICPKCNAPGFGKTSLNGHLCCDVCNTPTTLYKNKRLHCIQCEYTSTLEREDGLLYAEQKNCPFCNP